MDQACQTALAQLTPTGLQKVLLRASIRMIRSLVAAYPQDVGVAFFDALAPRVNPSTLRLLVEELNRGQVLTPAQVRSAESEFLKLIKDEQVPSALAC